MSRNRLTQDGDGDMWLHADEEGDCTLAARLLGPPVEALYDVVPPELWDALGTLIREAREAERYGRECRQEVEATYRRSRL